MRRISFKIITVKIHCNPLTGRGKTFLHGVSVGLVGRASSRAVVPVRKDRLPLALPPSPRAVVAVRKDRACGSSVMPRLWLDCFAHLAKRLDCGA